LSTLPRFLIFPPIEQIPGKAAQIHEVLCRAICARCFDEPTVIQFRKSNAPGAFPVQPSLRKIIS